MSDTSREAVEVVLTNRGAIYVNNTRITHRGTKWGMHSTLAEFECSKCDVVNECLSRGYDWHVRNISDPSYKPQEDVSDGE